MTNSKYQQEVDKNYEWFIKNKSKIIRENPKKIGYFVLIKNQELIGLYKTYEEITIVANTKFKYEPFSIQQLEKEEFIHSLGFYGLKWVK